MSEMGTAKLILQLGIPYGPLIYNVKEECKSHVTKRMGTGLWSIVKNHKSIT